MRRLRLALAGTVILALVNAVPAMAITDGELDEDGHPQVGLMVAQDKDGNPLWRCSGTLISPILFLTAGHCTEAPAVSAEIWFDPDVESDIPGNGYPFAGDVSGKTYTHPQYDPNRFWLHDLGMVQLDKRMPAPYASVAGVDSLDRFKTKRGKSKLWFTAVGYGLQRSFPTAKAAEKKVENVRVRMVAYPKLIQINTGYVGDYSLLLSNNANTGGTCFGDSGGPNFFKGRLVIAGITSYGKNGNCKGTGGVYRVDRQDDHDFINSFPRR